MIGKWLCKKFDMHSYKYLTEPVYDRVRLGDGASVIFAPRMRRTLRYCKHCRTLEYYEQIRAIETWQSVKVLAATLELSCNGLTQHGSNVSLVI